MGVGAADDRGVVHPGQDNVVHVMGQALDQSWVFLALERLADMSMGGGHGSSWAIQRFRGFIFFAAYSTASTMCWYPVQRQRLPERACRISPCEGFGFVRSNSTDAKIIPGVQNPHC